MYTVNHEKTRHFISDKSVENVRSSKVVESEFELRHIPTIVLTKFQYMIMDAQMDTQTALKQNASRTILMVGRHKKQYIKPSQLPSQDKTRIFWIFLLYRNCRRTLVKSDIRNYP